MKANKIPVQKLILLFIARGAPHIRRSHLYDAALSTLTMDYFEAARSLDELIGSDLIRLTVLEDSGSRDAEDRDVERCELTDKGLEGLEALENQIPVTTRRFLTAYLDRTHLQRTTADTLTAKVEETPDGRFRLTCRQLEDDDSSFSFTLLLPTEAMARKAASNWRERPGTIFSALLDSLLAEDKEKP